MSLKKTLAFAFAGLAATAALTTSANAAPDPDLSITRVHQNVKGVDTAATAKYEWVEVKCATPGGCLMGGYRIEDAAGNEYDFPNFTLNQNQRVQVHTGVGVDVMSAGTTTVHLYWDRHNHVWGNAKDVAFLMNGAVEEDRTGWDAFYIVS